MCVYDRASRHGSYFIFKIQYSELNQGSLFCRLTTELYSNNPFLKVEFTQTGCELTLYLKQALTHQAPALESGIAKITR